MQASAAAACRLRLAPPVDSALGRLLSTSTHQILQGWEVTQEDGPVKTRLSLGPDGPRLAEEARHPAGWRSSPRQLAAGIAAQAATTFLPAGYPCAVAPGYLRYATWQALHHCAGSANGVLASTFMLYSVGLGAGAVPTAGALNWVLKDGLGQLGTLLFGRALAHNFDVNSRLWYLLASTKLNLAIGLEISTILLPAYFLPIGSLANALKGLAWMAGGSSRSAFNVAFAIDSNIADVTAKATSQTICTSLVGTAAGIAIATSIGHSPGLALASYAGVAAVHLYSGYRSVQSVPLATLNPARLQLLVARFLGGDGAQPPQPPSQSPELPRPAEVAALEPILPAGRRQSGDGSPRLDIGPRLRDLSPEQQQELWALLPAVFGGERHVLLPGGGGGRGMAVLLHQQADAGNCVLAFLHAALLQGQLQAPQEGPPPAAAERDDAVLASLAAARRRLPALLASLEEAGWDTKRVVLESKRRRLVW